MMMMMVMVMVMVMTMKVRKMMVMVTMCFSPEERPSTASKSSYEELRDQSPRATSVSSHHTIRSTCAKGGKKNQRSPIRLLSLPFIFLLPLSYYYMVPSGANVLKAGISYVRK